MNFFMALASWSLWAFGLFLVFLQIMAREAGYALGTWHKRHREAKDEGVGLIVSSILGLLVFVLALDLSAASTRFGERRSGALAEANAIGTAWLQAKAMEHPRAAKIADLVEDYAGQRVIFVSADLGSPDLITANDASQALQTEIWGHLTALLRDDPGPFSTSLMNALNATFDATTAMRFAMGLSLPPQLIWLLVTLCVIGMALLGYQFGLQGKHHRVLTLLMCVLWTTVVVEILDIGTARVGVFRTGIQPYEWTIQGFAEVPIPPLAQ